MIKKLPSEEIKELYDEIRYGSGPSKVKAVQRLGRIRREDCVEPLLYALKDSYYLTRVAAIQSLSWIGDRRMIDPLINILKNDSNDIVRFSAAEVLAPLINEDDKIRDAFEEILNNGNLAGELKDLIKTVLS